eukprot:Rmarinus@m.5368
MARDERESIFGRKLDVREKRRNALLKAQESRRTLILDALRDVGSGADEIDSVMSEEANEDTGKRTWETRRMYYRNKLMLPEWIIEPPSDLASGWFVVPRPEGKRCLVVAARGRTTVRSQSGDILERFHSMLPSGGSRIANEESSGICVLDCVCHRGDSLTDNTYFVLDVMCWRGRFCVDSDSEFRFFWKDSKLSEVPVSSVTPQNERVFAPVPHWPATSEGIQSAYMACCQRNLFRPDGLIFYCKRAHYLPGTVTPLMLLYKDNMCSLYHADAITPPLRAVLHCNPDGTLRSDDVPPVIVASIDLSSISPTPDPGALVRISYSHACLPENDTCVESPSGTMVEANGGDSGGSGPAVLPSREEDGDELDSPHGPRDGMDDLSTDAEGPHVLVTDVQYMGSVSRKRAYADTWTKLVFHSNAIHQPLTIAEIISQADLGAYEDQNPKDA